MLRGKKGRIRKFFIAFACVLSMVLSMGVLAQASNVEAITDARSGVVQVQLVYVDQAGNEHFIQGGTAFLIDEQYVITNYHVVHMDDDMKAASTEALGVDFVNTTVSGLKMFVAVRRDMKIESTEVNGSKESDFSILKLSQSLKDRTYLPLGTSDNIAEAQTVYALGFPALSDAFTDAQYYTSEDVTITSGIVNKKIVENGVPYIQHSAELSDGNSGGPLLNENGVVVGVNRYVIAGDETGTKYNRSIDISDIRSYLDSLGVPYVDASDEEPAPTEEPSQESTPPASSDEPEGTDQGNRNETPAPSVDKTDLDRVIGQAKDLDVSIYSQDSVQAMNSALSDAQGVQGDENASQGDVDEATAALRNAIRNLEEKEGIPLVLIIAIVAAVLVILVVVIVIVAVSSSKKKKKEQEAQRVAQQNAMRQQPPQSRGYAGAPQGGMPQGMSQGMPQTVPQRPPVYQTNPMGPGEGAGETSLLNSGAGETTLLGGQGRVAASLVRVKTGETVSISKQIFTIGKERRKVDFCISDNNSISRTHAQIICKGSDYYIVDQNSTNYTFVNGNKVEARQEVQLKSGDRIKLADEEFEFKLF